MNIFFADINAWTGLGGLAVGLGCLVVAIVVAAKKQATQIYPQPLTVEIVKELHEQFADKSDFKQLAAHTSARHGQLFNEINRVERDVHVEIDRRLTELNLERRATLEKLNEQFTFIRENVSAINRELQIRHKHL